MQKKQKPLYMYYGINIQSDINDLEKALPYLKKVWTAINRLVNLTKGTYLYANSMQTQQRKIPMRGVDGTFKKWSEVLIPFEAGVGALSNTRLIH